ncbi:unnamed protein product [Lactuca saligna]|uniref:ABC transmembrane type-1 domain-containing protein n=1 Tax=Lactuca saligna TaxID=75948 RepID=A0AA36A2P5_LACSI|nr:unnamed protein product [Lactuca saligna]
MGRWRPGAIKIDGAMSGGIAKTIIARRCLFRRSCGASVRLLVGSATDQEYGIPNVGVRHPVMVGNFIHYLSKFLAGLVVGFVSARKLALHSVTVIPGIAFAGGLYTYTLTGLTSKSRESYANAGIIAEQAIAQVKIVYSYVGETKVLDSYSDAIQHTLKLGTKQEWQKDWDWDAHMESHACHGHLCFGMRVYLLGMGRQMVEKHLHQSSLRLLVEYGKCLTEVNVNIEFKVVSFSYPSKPDVLIFKEFSIFFPDGKTVAVVL